MFSSKSSRGKWVWALVDLLVVIIGVYIAFLIQSSAASEKDKKEQEKVFSSLKYELEQFRIIMPGMASYAHNRVEEFQNVAKENTYVSFNDWRFIEPQYKYQIVEYSINIQNTDIINFELYSILQDLYNEIKKLEHAERLMMETSMRFKTLPSGLAKSDPLYQLTWTNNYDNFVRFITFFKDRAEILQRVSDVSKDALPLINRELGSAKSKEIESKIILNNTGMVKNEEEAVAFVKQAFPNFTEEEVRQLYRKATSQ